MLLSIWGMCSTTILDSVGSGGNSSASVGRILNETFKLWILAQNTEIWVFRRYISMYMIWMYELRDVIYHFLHHCLTNIVVLMMTLLVSSAAFGSLILLLQRFVRWVVTLWENLSCYSECKIYIYVLILYDFSYNL